MAVIVRTHSATMALLMVCPVLAFLRVSPRTAYMLSEEVFSQAPRQARILSILICTGKHCQQAAFKAVIEAVQARASLLMQGMQHITPILFCVQFHCV